MYIVPSTISLICDTGHLVLQIHDHDTLNALFRSTFRPLTTSFCCPSKYSNLACFPPTTTFDGLPVPRMVIVSNGCVTLKLPVLDIFNDPFETRNSTVRLGVGGAVSPSSMKAVPNAEPSAAWDTKSEYGPARVSAMVYAGCE
jgi:hypothetical protein